MGYAARLQELSAGLAHALSKQSQYTSISAIAAAVFLGLLVLGSKLIWLAVPCAAGALAWRERSRWSLSALKQRRLISYYEAGLQRISGEWQGRGYTGLEYRQPGHAYAQDLGILGEGSLFELLCTARTEAGRRRLADFLLRKPSRAEALARQASVQELKPQTELREKIALLGRFDFEECRGDAFAGWQASSMSAMPRRLMQFSTLLMAFALSALYQLLPWNPVIVPWKTVIPIAGTLLAIQWGWRYLYRDTIRPLVSNACAMASDLNILREGMQILKHADTSTIAKLSRLANALSNSLQGPLEPFAKILLADVHLAFAMDDWKRKHGARLAAWTGEWAEFEALNAIAGYAYEHPGNSVPEIAEGPARFETTDLAHPLLHEPVRNDISLGGAAKFYVISGSNMAGKSTLLRSIGLNAVLASTGAPVQATHATTSIFSICASLSIADSLASGKSKFMAELDRIQTAIADAKTGEPTLFLFDEILSGTNSRDRHVAAEHIIRELIQQGAVGALSTHDLALTAIAAIPGLGGGNVHMSSPDESAPLAFDYLLKPGIFSGSNALAIARMAGVDIPDPTQPPQGA